MTFVYCLCERSEAILRHHTINHRIALAFGLAMTYGLICPLPLMSHL